MIDKKILLLLAYASSKLMARDAARFSIANLKEKSESTYIPSDFFCYYFVIIKSVLPLFCPSAVSLNL